MTHTPGPWGVGLREDQTIFTENLLRVATVECPRKEWKANARLIAAAPDLLDMCERLLGFALFRADPTALAAGDGMINAAKALIAKAKGGAA